MLLYCRIVLRLSTSSRVCTSNINMHSHDPHDYKVVQRDQMRKQKINSKCTFTQSRNCKIVYEILVTNQLHFQFNIYMRSRKTIWLHVSLSLFALSMDGISYGWAASERVAIWECVHILNFVYIWSAVSLILHSTSDKLSISHDRVSELELVMRHLCCNWEIMSSWSRIVFLLWMQ